jgi:hypothetical protein
MFWGKAPAKVLAAPGATILAYIDRYRANEEPTSYGYETLFKVWWSQLTGKDVEARRQVCSTFVQGAWETTGWWTDDTESPGGFLDHVQELRPLEV